tara:strand:+ start:2769 stop:3542 length:774 start_codon:yes stop_codon:yes gene_type:complete
MQIEFLQKKPFYIFKIENFLNDEEYQTLEENFPSNENKTKISGQDEGNKQAFDNRDESYKNLMNKKNIAINILEKKFDEKFCLELLRKLKKEIFISRLVNLTNISNLKNLYSIIRKPKLVTNEIKKNFLQKFFYSHFQRVFEFSYMHKGAFLLPHTDQKSKLISLMLYFPSKNLENANLGTTFYKSKSKNFSNQSFNLFKKENNVSLEENFEETLTVPYKKKDLFCFIKSDVSWHAVKKLEIPENEVRKSVNVFLKI